MTEPTPSVIVIDTITSSVDNIPADAPYVAGYDTGNKIQWTTENWQRFSGVELHINQQPNSPVNPDQWIDVEALAWTVEEAATVAKSLQDSGATPKIYIAAGAYASLIAGLQAAGVTAAFIWQANWNLSQEEATSQLEVSGAFQTIIIQWASPSSNPNTLLPGSALTLKEANCDLSVGLASFLNPAPIPAPAPDPAATNTAVIVTTINGEFVTTQATSADGETWVISSPFE